MKQFINKLIERLEKDNRIGRKSLFAFMEILNQLAGEYLPETNVGNIQTIDVSELLGESEQWTKYINYSSNYERGYEDGWNDCMETIQASAPYQPKGQAND